MMRSAVLLWLIIIALPSVFQPLHSQTAKEVFNSAETPVTYLGIDFTRARLIGDAAAVAADFRDKHFSAINQVVVNEPKKYDLAKAFKKTTVNSDIAMVSERNSKIEAEQLKVSSASVDNDLNAAEIQKIISDYNLEGKKGVGLVFIVESLNKTAAKGSMFVTFIDMGSKKVLFTERMTGSAGGFGNRNYWVKTVFEVLEQIEKTKYKEWKSRNT